MSNLVLEAKSLTRAFNEAGRELTIIDHLDLAVKSGERIAIIGSSGSGKSTLLNLLAALDTPSSGEVLIAGKSISALTERQRSALRNRELGFVFQFHHLLPEFSATENVAMPMLLAGKSTNEARERALELLEQVGLKERSEHRPAKLSGGERQRVAIARALANAPGCVLMDEPTGNLDPTTAKEVEAQLSVLNQHQGVAQIIVTHDHDLASRMDRVLSLQNGKLTAI